MYVPSVVRSTVPLAVTEPEPSTLSVHVAPRSVYVPVATWATVIVPEPLRVITGGCLSIFVTVAIVEPVFPLASWNVNVNDPFCVNVCVVPPVLVIVIDSDAPVRVAITSWFVAPVFE